MSRHTMRAAFAVCNDRIAPVFDVARRIRLVTAVAGELTEDRPADLPEPGPDKALFLAALRVGTLVCGAVSRSLEGLVAAYGIRVHPFVSGDADEVVRAWIEGRLGGGHFAMPGRNRRGRALAGPGKEADVQGNTSGTTRGQGGGGAGSGRGGGGQGGGRGRSGRPGPGGACVCPTCGRTLPHEQGKPCMEMRCPDCGAAMVRQ